MDSTIKYGVLKFCMNFHAIVWLVDCPKPRVLLGFHHNPKIIEGKVVKTLNGTRRMWNSPFVVGFMV